MMGEQPEISAGFPARLGLFLARFCSAAWIGAASLFVVVGIREVTKGGFDSATKDALVAIRFPSFYQFGVVLIGIAWIGVLISRDSMLLSPRRRIACLVLLAIVLALMAADYVWIYEPLLQMVTPPGQAKPSGFHEYHQASKWINSAGLIVCCIAAGLLNWPSRHTQASGKD